ncbi:MAG: hypothetical protein IPN20_20610 [Haliscomenobacter sp.]|nr:hypothetical protein [Haliscomenobacter sp.]
MKTNLSLPPVSIPKNGKPPEQIKNFPVLGAIKNKKPTIPNSPFYFQKSLLQ